MVRNIKRFITMPEEASGRLEKRSLSQRLAGLRNFQSKDFWAMVFARPLTILFLLPVADVPWVTPNLITVLSNIVKFAGIGVLLACPSYMAGVVGAILVNLGLILDNMDGTLARYRNCSSYIGFYFDKAGDLVTLVCMFAAVGARVYLYGGSQAGNVWDIFIPLAAGAGQATGWYCKWVAQKVIGDMEIKVNASKGTLPEMAAVRLVQNPVEEPPHRTPVQWILWFFSAIKSILYINEVDIFFFLALFLVLDQTWIFTRYVCIVYAANLVVGPVYHFFRLRKALVENGIK